MALLFLVHYRVSIPPFISFFLFSKIHRNNHFVMLLLSFAPQNISILFKILWKIHAREFPFQYSCRLQPSNVIKNRLRNRCFPASFTKFSRTYFEQVCKRLFYNFRSSRLRTELEKRHFGRQTKPPNWSTALQTLFGKDK